MANDIGSILKTEGGQTVMQYRTYPTTQAFHDSEAYTRVILGPRGSGKSSCCIQEMVRLAKLQAPAPDGLRHTRWLVIRNTYGELKKTTLASFLHWFPNGVFGQLRMGMPITYEMAFADVRAEFIFLALDEPEDVQKLMSMECTGAWINEGQFVPQEILDHLPGSVGRYPARSMGGATRKCILMDSNPPPEDHWIPRLETEVEKARNKEHDRKYFEALPPNWDGIAPEEVPLGWSGDMDLQEIPINPDDYAFFHQPPGLSEEAENIPELPDGYMYYLRLGQGKSPAFIESLVMGRYSGVLGGTPVYPEFRERQTVNGQRIWWHVSPKVIEPVKGWPIYLGWDYGLTPACLVAQISPRGQLLILQEIECKRMGLKQFVRDRVRPWLATKFMGYSIISTGDPAGEAASPTDMVTCHQILVEAGIPTDPAYTNGFMTRRDAVGDFLNSTVVGQPGILIDPRCQTLIEGFRRGYRYRKAKIEGETRETEKVDKHGNRFTHLQDCLQYICLRLKLDQQWAGFEEIIRAGGGASHAPVIP